MKKIGIIFIALSFILLITGLTLSIVGAVKNDETLKIAGSVLYGSWFIGCFGFFAGIVTERDRRDK